MLIAYMEICLEIFLKMRQVSDNTIILGLIKKINLEYSAF